MRDVSKGWAPGYRHDLEIIEQRMKPRRAAIAFAMMYILEREARRDDRGKVSITDAELAARIDAQRKEVANVRTLLCRYGLLKSVEPGRKGFPQVLRVTCFDAFEASFRRDQNETKEDQNETKEDQIETKDGARAKHGSGSGDACETKEEQSETREDQSETKEGALTKGRYPTREREPEEVSLFPACSDCDLPEEACVCPNWSAYRDAVQRWGSSAGSRAKALARLAKMPAARRREAVRLLGELIAFLNAANPDTSKIFGLVHLSTWINAPKAWAERPDILPKTGGRRGAFDRRLSPLEVNDMSDFDPENIF